MKKKSTVIRLSMTEKRRRKRCVAVQVPEMVLALFLLCGILSACQDMMYMSSCLGGAALTGTLVILFLHLAECFPRRSHIIKIGIYVAALLCFLGFLPYIAQGFLDTVNRCLSLWNFRFQTEWELFSVTGGAGFGSLVFWCLLSVPLAALLLVLVKKRRMGVILVLVVGALFAGFVLGHSQIWGSVLCFLFGSFGMLIYTAAPERQIGIRGVFCILFLGAAFLLFASATDEYEGLVQLTQWRAEMAAWFERFRYGEDTLPKGDLGKAQDLLQGEDERLTLTTENPQEWYLRGFIGGSYQKTSWESLPMEAYQGKYEGILKWLEARDFSTVTQFARYQELTEKEESSDLESVQVQVDNTGAYRKYMYLPSSVEKWTQSRSEIRKDWQVCAKGFFGERAYEFRAVDGAPLADGITPAAWMENPAGEKEKIYLDTESVYHSFAEDSYKEVESDLKSWMEALFFSGKEKKDFNGVTAQIRRILRQETSYTANPPTMPAGEDFVRWFLEDSRQGNAVHYASAAVLAYRTAGYAARYVEGYHYPDRAGQIHSEDLQKTAVLTSQNAHAWVEVYVSGVGWMPVEVVPGMYTELYTNQIKEGRPSFQMNANPGEEGMETEGEAAGTQEPKEREEKIPLSLRRRVSVAVFILYLCLLLFLILEGQRMFRRTLRKKRIIREQSPVFVDWYAAEIERLLLIGKIEGNYNHPLELSAQVEEKISGISREEYVRAVELLQKIRFGEKKLLPYEMHTLDCFLARLSKALFRQGKPGKKFRIRYWNALV